MFAVSLFLLAAPAAAKKYRYSTGPKAPNDTTYSVADIEIEPIVRSRGPTVPATNLQMTALVARTAFTRAMVDVPLDSTDTVVLAPSSEHPLNFVAEHVVLRELAKRGVAAMVRRAPVPDDSVALVSLESGGKAPLLEYQIGSARVTYLRLIGWLPGRVKIERQALVEATMTLRDREQSKVLWTGFASQNLLDSFPRSQLPLVEDPRFNELTSPPPERNAGRIVEPVIVVAIVVGLIALFFQNRP
jgi:hypothetical protein